MTIESDNAALSRCVLLLAHALRLNTTAPQHDQGFAPWPQCPYAVMDRVKSMLEGVSPRTSAVCAAIVVLDAERTEDWMIEQPDLLTRMHYLAQPPMTSGSPPA